MMERQPPAFLNRKKEFMKTKVKKQPDDRLTLAQRILLAIMIASIVGVFALTFWNLYKEVYNV